MDELCCGATFNTRNVIFIPSDDDNRLALPPTATYDIDTDSGAISLDEDSIGVLTYHRLSVVDAVQKVRSTVFLYKMHSSDTPTPVHAARLQQLIACFPAGQAFRCYQVVPHFLSTAATAMSFAPASSTPAGLEQWVLSIQLVDEQTSRKRKTPDEDVDVC